MARRNFRLTPAARDELIGKLDGLTGSLIDDHAMDTEDAGDLIGLLVGDALEMALRVAGVPEAAADPMGEEIGEFIGKAVTTIAEALSPDAEKVMARATTAMRNGHPKRAARLFKKAERLFKKAEAAPVAPEAGD